MSYKDNIQVIEKLKKLVVKISVFDERNQTFKKGTGFFLDSKHIITANHVVSEVFESGYSVRVCHNQSGGKITSNAQVLHRQPKVDFNILRIYDEILGNDIEFVKMIPKSYRKFKFSYSAYGFPAAKPEGHHQSGVILDEIDLFDNSIIDVSLGDGRLNNYSGFSGAPVVCNGQLIGIATEQSVGLNTAQSIKVLSVSTFAEELSKDWLGNDSFISDILDLFRVESEKEINQNKINKKYIPEIFVELGDIKEHLRGFSNPVLFFEKHLAYVKMHNFEQYNQLLDFYGIKRIDNINCKTEVTLSNIDRVVNNLICQLKDIESYVKELKSFTKIRESVPEGKLPVFDVSYPSNKLYYLSMEVDKRIKLFESLKNSQVLLLEKAGQGKTNLLCDFTENVLLRKTIPCLFISARYLINGNFNDTLLNYFPFCSNIEDLFEIINYISAENQLPFVFIIDGLNEQKELINKRFLLYDFLNKAKNYNHIRILMTARTEYFEDKFGDMHSHCPQLKKIGPYNGNSQCDKFKSRIFSGYMEHFNIRIDNIEDSIYDQLATDFLLLRMFAEAYQGTKEEKTIIPSLLHLYRYEIFDKYYDYKKENLKEWDRAQGIYDSKSTYDNLIDAVTMYMISNRHFSNIERSIIVDEIKNELLVKLIDEDIIFREDIVRNKGLIKSNYEVINFTFDEFRDFCIAKRIMEIFNEDNIDSYETLISELTSRNSEASEGIQKYLFFASKKLQNEIFAKLIEKQEWYFGILLGNIFSINEEYLQEKDIKIIENFLTNVKNYIEHRYWIVRIYSSLIKHYDTNTYKKLNIRLLVTILEKISDKDFRIYVFDIFKPSYQELYYLNDKEHIYIDKLIEKFKDYYVESFNKEIILFLGYLNYRNVHTNNFFNWCIEKFPEETILILEDLINSDNQLDAKVFIKIVESLSFYDFDFKQETSERWKKIKSKYEQNRKCITDVNEVSHLTLFETLKKLDLHFKKKE